MYVHSKCENMNRMKETKKVNAHILLDPYLDVMLMNEAKTTGKTKTEIIEEALRMYFESKLKKVVA